MKREAISIALGALLVLSPVALCQSSNPPQGLPLCDLTKAASPGAVEITSQTDGVDLGPYLRQVLPAIRAAWYNLIPSEARPPVSRAGCAGVEFKIQRDGSIAGEKYVSSSGIDSLDRAAWGAIVRASPLAALPSEYKGDYLALRFHFFYNSPPGTVKDDTEVSGSAELAPFVVMHAWAQDKGTQQARADSSNNSDQQLQLGSPIHSVDPVIPKNLYGKKPAAVIGATLKIDGTFAELSALAGDREFEEAALDAVHQWRYTPATLNGTPVDAPVFISILCADGDVKIKLALNPPFPTKPKVPTADQFSRGELFAVDQKTVKAPKSTFSPDPEYSEIARMAKFQGTCVIGVILGRDGLVSDAWVMRKLGFGLDHQALESVRQWKFDPAMKDGQPVPVLLAVEVNFKLYDSPAASANAGKDIAAASNKAEPLLASMSVPQQSPEVPSTSSTPQTAIVPGALVHKVIAKYPKEARKAKIEGQVVLQATIEPNGDVSGVSIVSGDFTLAEEAVDAVKSWKFDPYSQNGRPVKVVQSIVFNFSRERKEADLEPLPSAALATAPHSGVAVFRVGNGVTPPKAIYSPDPQYDEKARKAKYQGVVILALVVTPEGTPRDIRVVRALGQGLDEKAIEAVRKWKFQPAMKDGQPVAVAINIEVVFHLY